ncbi:Rhamnulokinase [Rubripirellula lacrimiformis]|uniref:Rhamnulokinase n=1 Tax=Rubripirellula lacrimiformis TaxID=1930273 RepID=A0A517NGS9_9BACT|nr:rhamnulokinase family protein [Rubripirellula lacrimiformis]QDT06335.1 Rhamnulokinase [Rubripirellula lacrimiformis]
MTASTYHPNASPAYLAVDLGASSGRVIAGVLIDGKLTLEAVHRFANDPVRVQDSLQWDLIGLWKEIQTGLRIAANKYSDVQSVGVDSWGVDYVLIDRNGQFAGSMFNYRDNRTQGMLEKSFQIVPRREIFAATGLQFMQINTLYQLLAAKLADDPALQVAERFLMIGDFFHWLLSGKASNEITNVSTSQLLDPRAGDWSRTLIDRFGLPSKLFGRLTPPGTDLGPVQPSVAEVTGLHDVPVIVPATHDTASAVLAVPAEDFAPAKPDWCYISSGTWSLMGCELNQPMITDRCAELNFTNETGVGGSTRLLKNIGGLWIFQQIRQSMIRRGKEVSWDDMVQQAKAAPAFSLLIDPDAADFVAPTDMVDAIVAYAKRTGQPEPTSDGVFYRGALEGLAIRYRVCLGMLESMLGHPLKTIHIVGGGAVNALLCQMTADACDRNVIAGPVEATAIGNVLMQMIGLGKLDSFDDARQLVRASFEPEHYQPTDSEAWTEPAQRAQLW